MNELKVFLHQRVEPGSVPSLPTSITVGEVPDVAEVLGSIGHCVFKTHECLFQVTKVPTDGGVYYLYSTIRRDFDCSLVIITPENFVVHFPYTTANIILPRMYIENTADFSAVWESMRRLSALRSHSQTEVSEIDCYDVMDWRRGRSNYPDLERLDTASSLFHAGFSAIPAGWAEHIIRRHAYPRNISYNFDYLLLSHTPALEPELDLVFGPYDHHPRKISHVDWNRHRHLRAQVDCVIHHGMHPADPRAGGGSNLLMFGYFALVPNNVSFIGNVANESLPDVNVAAEVPFTSVVWDKTGEGSLVEKPAVMFVHGRYFKPRCFDSDNPRGDSANYALFSLINVERRQVFSLYSVHTKVQDLLQPEVGALLCKLRASGVSHVAASTPTSTLVAAALVGNIPLLPDMDSPRDTYLVFMRSLNRGVLATDFPDLQHTARVCYYPKAVL